MTKSRQDNGYITDQSEQHGELEYYDMALTRKSLKEFEIAKIAVFNDWTHSNNIANEIMQKSVRNGVTNVIDYNQLSISATSQETSELISSKSVTQVPVCSDEVDQTSVIHNTSMNLRVMDNDDVRIVETSGRPDLVTSFLGTLRDIMNLCEDNVKLLKTLAFYICKAEVTHVIPDYELRNLTIYEYIRFFNPRRRDLKDLTELIGTRWSMESSRVKLMDIIRDNDFNLEFSGS